MSARGIDRVGQRLARRARRSRNSVAKLDAGAHAMRALRSNSPPSSASSCAALMSSKRSLALVADVRTIACASSGSASNAWLDITEHAAIDRQRQVAVVVRARRPLEGERRRRDARESRRCARLRTRVPLRRAPSGTVLRPSISSCLDQTGSRFQYPQAQLAQIGERAHRLARDGDVGAEPVHGEQHVAGLGNSASSCGRKRPMIACASSRRRNMPRTRSTFSDGAMFAQVMPAASPSSCPRRMRSGTTARRRRCRRSTTYSHLSVGLSARRRARAALSSRAQAVPSGAVVAKRSTIGSAAWVGVAQARAATTTKADERIHLHHKGCSHQGNSFDERYVHIMTPAARCATVCMMSSRCAQRRR